MSIEYTNRVGKRYYLRVQKTKTGKDKFLFTTNDQGKGQPVDQIPEGFEIYEHPENAQVFLRKKRPQLIIDLEKQLITEYVENVQRKRSKKYRIDCKDDLITIYESDRDSEALEGLIGKFMTDLPLRPGLNVDDAKNMLFQMTDRNYSPVLRFRLLDQGKRLFVAERFCYLGGIDDWTYLTGPSSLKKLADKYIKLLGTEEFFREF